MAASLDNDPGRYAAILPGLRAHARQSSEAGITAKITSENFEQLATPYLQTPIPEKLRRILIYLGERSDHPGAAITIDPADDPLFNVAESAHMTFLLETLVERGDVKDMGEDIFGHRRYVMTAQGWDRLTPSANGWSPGTVFVAMAFGDDMQKIFDDAIEPAITIDCLLTVTQVSRIEHNGSISDVIMAGIRAAQVVVADVTHQRNGVYFEGGFAMGLGRVVVWMCREDDLPNVHFDTRQYNHITWKDSQDLRTKLSNRLRATVAVPLRG